jgi:SAM-dependent methyltransferase
MSALLKVELGAGATKKPGWKTVDVNPAFEPDYVASALHLPFADGSVDWMRAVDVLEHLSYRDTHGALAEWARVMRRGGELYVQVPDADTIMDWYVNDPTRLGQTDKGPCTALEGATWRLLGGHHDDQYAGDDDDWRWNAHYALFSRGSLHTALDRAGFDVVSLHTNGHPNLLCNAVRV